MFLQSMFTSKIMVIFSLANICIVYIYCDSGSTALTTVASQRLYKVRVHIMTYCIRLLFFLKDIHLGF